MPVIATSSANVYAEQEIVRRGIVSLVFVVFLLLIFEGALRKWALPEVQRPLYFARDPFVLMIYGYALVYGMISRSTVMYTIILFAVPVSMLHLLLALLGTGHPVAWALGVRHYFFYIPLAFIMGHCLRFDDVARLVRFNLFLAVPIGLLVYVQHRSPPTAFINRALADGSDAVTWVANDVLRPYGTFTHASGHVLYVAASVAMLALAWLLRREMRLSLWLLLPSSVATLVMALTTGSRAIWFFLASTALCLAVVAMSTMSISQRSRSLGFVTIALLGVIVLYASMLTPAYEAMLARQEVAARSEGSIFLRVFGSVTHAFEILDEAPVAGSGLGAGILGAVAVTTGERFFALAETEWDRIVLELGPVLGLGFIGLRIVVVAWLFRVSMVANRVFANPAGLLLFSFAGLHVFNGQITMSGQGSVFAWFFVGLTLAATNSVGNRIR